MPKKKTFENYALGSVSFDIPMEAEALKGAARMLSRLADETLKDELEDPSQYPPGHRREGEAEEGKTQTPPPKGDSESEGGSIPPDNTNTTTGETEPDGTTPTTTAVATAELDTSGLPWDLRIHARTKSKTASGLWTKKRGVDAKLVSTVEAELRAAPLNTGGTPPPPPDPGVPPNTSGENPPSDPSPPAEDEGPIINMRQLSLRITAEKLPKEVVEAATAQVGVATLPLLGAKPELIPEVAAYLGLV